MKKTSGIIYYMNRLREVSVSYKCQYDMHITDPQVFYEVYDFVTTSC